MDGRCPIQRPVPSLGRDLQETTTSPRTGHRADIRRKEGAGVIVVTLLTFTASSKFCMAAKVEKINNVLTNTKGAAFVIIFTRPVV